MTVQTGKDGTISRQVFTPAAEKPVAIFLPQHRKRERGAAVPILSAFIGLATAFAATAAYMLPDAAEADPSAVSQALAEAKETSGSATAETQTAVESSATDEGTDAAAAETSPNLPASTPIQEASAAEKASTEIPPADDPRWAKSAAPSGAAALAAVKALMAENGSSRKSEDAPGVMAYASPEAGAARVREDTDDDQTASVDPAAGKIKAPKNPMPDVEQTRVNAAVNMRAGPGSEHGVLLVIPAKAAVELYGCKSWCKVAYDGRTGYIYKSFVGAKGKSRASAAGNTPTKKAEEPVKTVSVVSTVEETTETETAPIEGPRLGR